jgi:hypothetical protein
MGEKRYVKICSNKKCTNRINEAQELECVECGCDLVMVTMVEYTEELRELVESGSYPLKAEPQPQPQPEQKATIPEHVTKIVKVCESCGYENLPQIDTCEQCGDYIGDIMPVSKAQEEIAISEDNHVFHYELISLDGSYKYSIDKEWFIIGRLQECQSYLSNKPYVSREHAVLSVVDGKLMIEDRITANRNYAGGVNNRTFINGVSLVNGEVKELHNGDIIGLGGSNTCENNAGFFRVGLTQ